MEKSETLKNYEYIKEQEERLGKLKALKESVKKIDEITTKMSGSMDEELIKAINELAQEKLSLQKETEKLKKELGLENISDIDNIISKCEEEIKVFKMSMQRVESEIEDHISKLEEIKQSLMPQIKSVGILADGFKKLNQLDETLIEFAKNNLPTEQQENIINDCQNAIKKQELTIQKINSFIETDATKEIDNAINGYKEILDYIRKKDEPTTKKVIINLKNKKLSGKLNKNGVAIQKNQKRKYTVLPTDQKENDKNIETINKSTSQEKNEEQVQGLKVIYKNDNTINDPLVKFATQTPPTKENSLKNIIDSLENKNDDTINIPTKAESNITQHKEQLKKSEEEIVRNIPPLKRVEKKEQAVEPTTQQEFGQYSNKEWSERIVERLMNEEDKSQKYSSNIFGKFKRKVSPQQHSEILEETKSNISNSKQKRIQL